MSFVEDKESIVIYGAGERGKKLAELFCKKGYRVKTILDEKADSLNSIKVDDTTIPIIMPKQYHINSNDEIVIISLANAMQHEVIAEFLHQMGFEKIIYIPLRVDKNKQLLSQMRTIFNEILTGNCLFDRIPKYSDIISESTHYIVSKSEDYLIYMPVENLFVQEQFEVELEKLQGTEYIKRKKVLETAGENLISFKRYIQLYQYLDKTKGDCSDYLTTQISDFENISSEKKRILKDRYALFQIFEKAYAINQNFFEDSAPTVMWNKKGYFNIVDGHHRAMYLVYKGVWDIPIRIREEDRQYIELWKKVKGDFWCESPYLVNQYDSLTRRKVNAIICNTILKKDISSRTICVLLNDAGLLSRYCYRLGCKLCIDIENDKIVEFARKIYDVFEFSDRLNICMQSKKEIKTDIAVIDEKYISQNSLIYANIYILKIENDGAFHNYIKKNKIKYKYLGKVFDGEGLWLLIFIDNKNIKFSECFKTFMGGNKSGTKS